MDDAGIAPQSRKAVPGQYVAGSLERMMGDVDGGKLSVGNFDAFRIFILVKFGAHRKARICPCRGN